MPTTNFPNLLTSGGVPVMGTGPFVPTNQVFFVHSGTGVNGTGYGSTPSRPYASAHYASTQCTANKGDYIICLPGHVETITAAAGCVLGVAGVTVLGLGNGDNRPQFNFTTAVGADLDIDAAGVSIVNCRFTGGIDNITAMIDVNAANFSLINCSFRDVTGQVAKFLQGDANADELTIAGLDYLGAAAAGTTAAINLNGSAGFHMYNSRIDGNFSVGAVDIATVAATDVRIHDCWIQTRNAADICIIDTITASTGIMGPNLNLVLNDNAANITEAITGATFYYFDPIYVVNLAGEKAMLTNITASTDA